MQIREVAKHSDRRDGAGLELLLSISCAVVCEWVVLAGQTSSSPQVLGVQSDITEGKKAAPQHVDRGCHIWSLRLLEGRWMAAGSVASWLPGARQRLVLVQHSRGNGAISWNVQCYFFQFSLLFLPSFSLCWGNQWSERRKKALTVVVPAWPC